MSVVVRPPIHKYPRTRHLEGSRLQPGDEDLDAVPFAQICGRHVVVEEKLDGANAAVSFAPDGSVLLQSRGHYLDGGAREKHFHLFKQWASAEAEALRPRLGERHVLYGEWLYAKHTVFYDRLPAYFLEFDVLDRETGVFLSTPRRRALLEGTSVRSVPVLASLAPRTLGELTRLLGRSLYKSEEWRAELARAAEARSVDVERVLRETDPSPQMEGLYLKVEEDGAVAERYKFVRASFLTSVVDSGSHWLRRPIVPNQLAGDRS